MTRENDTESHAIARIEAVPYVSFIVDDTGNGREVGADSHAIIRPHRDSYSPIEFDHRSILIGWQCGFEPLFIAVHSYLDVRLDDDEAVELATDYLRERNWFSVEPTEPDYIIR